LFICFFGKAQNNTALKQQTNTYLFLPPATNFCAQQAVNLKIQPFKHEAFFCRMEDKLHARFNVWLTLRAGSDESYRQMIANPANRFD
jgi:hypothetical protein